MLPATAPEAPITGASDIGVGEHEAVAGGGRAQKIENEVAEVAERVLDVVGEHPQEDHVAGEVPEVAVEEGVGDERQPVGDGEEVQRPGMPPFR